MTVRISKRIICLVLLITLLAQLARANPDGSDMFDSGIVDWSILGLGEQFANVGQQFTGAIVNNELARMTTTPASLNLPPQPMPARNNALPPSYAQSSIQPLDGGVAQSIPRSHLPNTAQIPRSYINAPSVPPMPQEQSSTMPTMRHGSTGSDGSWTQQLGHDYVFGNGAQANFHSPPRVSNYGTMGVMGQEVHTTLPMSQPPTISPTSQAAFYQPDIYPSLFAYPPQPYETPAAPLPPALIVNTPSQSQLPTTQPFQHHHRQQQPEELIPSSRSSTDTSLSLDYTPLSSAPPTAPGMTGWLHRASTLPTRAPLPRVNTTHLAPPPSTSSRAGTRSPTSASSTGSSRGGEPGTHRRRSKWQLPLGRHPYTCKIPSCGAGFSSQAGLTHHARSHRPYAARQHACGICGKRFQYRKDLSRHLPGHDPNAPRFLCKVADCKYAVKGFGRQDHLDRHMGTLHPNVGL